MRVKALMESVYSIVLWDKFPQSEIPFKQFQWFLKINSCQFSNYLIYFVLLMCAFIYSVGTQNFPKNYHFLPFLLKVRNVTFSKNFAHVINRWSLSILI